MMAIAASILPLSIAAAQELTITGGHGVGGHIASGFTPHDHFTNQLKLAQIELAQIVG